MGTLPNGAPRDPLIRCDAPRHMAKADLTLREQRAPYGAILRRASELAGFNRDETARELVVDPATISRWWSGEENPQTWRYTAHSTLGLSLLVAHAEAHQNGDQIVVETVVRVMRRRA